MCFQSTWEGRLFGALVGSVFGFFDARLSVVDKLVSASSKKHDDRGPVLHVGDSGETRSLLRGLEEDDDLDDYEQG